MNGGKVGNDIFRQIFLVLHATDAGAAAVDVDLVNRCRRAVDPVEGKHIADVRVSGVASFDAVGIRKHLADFLADHRGRIGNIDGVVIAFAHLPAVDSQQLGNLG